jgi:hypothetical protein
VTERKEIVWCTDCGARFTSAETSGWGCPKCDSEGVPCGTDKDVWIEVNWHELHILTVWAENYAADVARRNPAEGAKMPLTVAAIARRIQQQWPAFGPLTLSVEIAELPRALSEKGIEITGVQGINIAKPKPIPVNGPGAIGHATGGPDGR